MTSAVLMFNRRWMKLIMTILIKMLFANTSMRCRFFHILLCFELIYTLDLNYWNFAGTKWQIGLSTPFCTRCINLIYTSFLCVGSCFRLSNSDDSISIKDAFWNSQSFLSLVKDYWSNTFKYNLKAVLKIIRWFSVETISCQIQFNP